MAKKPKASLKDADAISIGIALIIIFAIFFLTKIFGSSSSKGNKKSGSSSSYGPYKPKYKSLDTALALPTPEEAKKAAESSLGLKCKFLLCTKKQLERDYVLCIDRSGSMSGKLWKEAEEAVKLIAPQICKFDKDGITLIFFDHEVEKFENVQNAGQVMELFNTRKPRGSTDLAKGLDCAFQDHFGGTKGATTILVVTDGCPNSKEEARDVIIKAANALEVDAELSISFLQVGKDRSATKYLQELDDDLEGEAKFDIVDTLTSEEANNISFNELVARSIYD